MTARKQDARHVPEREFIGADRDAGRLAQVLLRFVQGDWLGEQVSAEARRFLISLAVGVYAAEQAGRALSKREACIEIMHTDVMRTGPKYIRHAELEGLIEIHRSASDSRKHYLVGTPKLKSLLERELLHISSAMLAKRDEQSGRKIYIRKDGGVIELEPEPGSEGITFQIEAGASSEALVKALADGSALRSALGEEKKTPRRPLVSGQKDVHPPNSSKEPNVTQLPRRRRRRFTE